MLTKGNVILVCLFVNKKGGGNKIYDCSSSIFPLAL